MAWEYRNGNAYYYDAVRVDCKPRRVYRGSGVEGRVYELLTRKERRLRAERAEAKAERTRALTRLRTQLRHLLRHLHRLVRARRLTAGEYRHRGQWRRRPAGFVTIPTGVQKMIDGPLPADLGSYVDHLNERANAGDRDALRDLNTFLDRYPEVWEQYASLNRDASGGWAAVLTGGAAERLCLRRATASRAIELAGPDPSPLVSAAAETAAVAELAARYAGKELMSATVKVRAKAAERAMSAERQVQDALKLVTLAKTAEAAVAASRTPAPSTFTAAPKLYAGAG